MILIYITFCIILLFLSLSKRSRFFKYAFTKQGFTEIQKTVLSYGYHYNLKTHLLSNFIFLTLLFFIGIQFEVRIESILLLSLLLILMMPHILIWLMFHAYQEKLFNSFTMFLQTFIAVFKITPKTYPALCECEKICEGEILDLIQSMKAVLMEAGTIESAMHMLCEYQPHFIVHNLATLILTIENHGGSYCDGLDLIQDDIDDWIEDIYSYKKKQTSTKNKMMGLCLLSTGIAFLSKNMLNGIPFDSQHEIYQIFILLFLLCLLFTVFMAHRIFSQSWFEKEEKL